jgi:MFS family permease
MRQPGEKRGVTVRDRPLKGAWGMTALIFLFMFINFADKAVLGLAAQPLMTELKLSPEQFGLIGSAFFLLFPVSAVLVGFVTNRVAARHSLLAMAILWSLVQFPMLGVTTLQVLMAVPVLNWIIVRYSWHWAFAALGLAGLSWVVLWALFGREGTLVDPPVGEEAAVGGTVPYRYLLTCPSIIAACCAGFVTYWGLALTLTWFTSYLVDGLGYSQSTGGDLSVLPWLIGLVMVLLGGWISQRLKTAGYSSRLSRGAFASATVFLGGCLLLFVGHMPTPGLKIALLTLGGAIGATIYVVIPMIVSELTPQKQRAAMLAIANSVMTSAGVIAPLVMGAVVQNAATPTAGYERGYLILGGLLLAGGLIGLLFIRPEQDRQALARHALPAASLQPAGG